MVFFLNSVNLSLEVNHLPGIYHKKIQDLSYRLNRVRKNKGPSLLFLLYGGTGERKRERKVFSNPVSKPVYNYVRAGSEAQLR